MLIGLLLAILIIWRLIKIFKIITTVDFISVLPMFIAFISFAYNMADDRPSSSRIGIYLFAYCFINILTIVWHRYFQNNVVSSRKINVSKSHYVVSVLLLLLFSAIIGLRHTQSGVIVFIIGILLLIKFKNFRLPWVVIGNIILLGLVVFRVESGDRGDGDIMVAESPEIVTPTPDYTYSYDNSDIMTTDSIANDTIYVPGEIGTSGDVSTPIDINNNLEPMETFNADNSIYAFGDSSVSPDTILNFGGVQVATLLDIPQINDNPNMLFALESVNSQDFQICSPNGMPEITCSDGVLYNNENVEIARWVDGYTEGTKILEDSNHNPILKVDANDQIFSGDSFVGRIQKSPAVTTIRDISGSIVTNIYSGGVAQDVKGNLLAMIKNN